MALSRVRLHELFFESSVSIAASTDLSQCELVFADAVAHFDMDVFACGEVDLSAPERNVMHVLHWPDTWRKFYLTSGFAARDPLVENLRGRRAPFTWSDMRADKTISGAGTEALREIAAHGWTEGLALPIPRSETQIGLVSLVGRRGPLEDKERDFLCSLGFLFHERVRLLAPRQAIAVLPSGMTKREIEALQQIGRGGTDADIARELGVSAATAHEFVEKAKRRLKASSRAQAIALAVSLAIVSL